MEIILPINQNSVMQCFNFESFLYNILSMEQSHEDWIHSNYFNVLMKKNWYEQDYNHIYSLLPLHENTPGLEINSLRRDFFKMQEFNIINVLIRAVKQKNYVYIYLDEYYLEDSLSYQNYHFTHDNLIIGVDTQKEIFFLFGYNHHKLLSIREVSYSNLEKSFEKLDQLNELSSDILFYKPVPCNYNFNIDRIKQNFTDYLYGRNTLYIDSRNHKSEFVYGIKILDVVKKIYMYNSQEIDMRLPVKLVEHKEISLQLIRFLLQKKYINDQSYEEKMSKIKQYAEIIKLYSLKINISKYDDSKNEIRKKILTLLDKIISKENELFKDLLIEIENTGSKLL